MSDLAIWLLTAVTLAGVGAPFAILQFRLGGIGRGPAMRT